MSARDRQRAADFRQLVRDDAAMEALRGVDPDAAQYEAFAAHVGPAPRCVLAQADPDEEDWELPPRVTLRLDAAGDYDPPYGDPEC